VIGYYALAVRAILAHAISDWAKRFYEKWGFIPSPVDPMTLMITVAEARKAWPVDTTKYPKM
jgi:hypothetical protein